MYDDQEGQSLDKYEGEGEKEKLGYIPLLFIAPPPPP